MVRLALSNTCGSNVSFRALTIAPFILCTGTSSVETFHMWPDGAATFPDTRTSNPGGWIWTSNAEDGDGGVGAVTFNNRGEVIEYKMVLTGTKVRENRLLRS